MDAADIRPVPLERRTQPAFDLFLIFAAANIVATTFQVGASLGESQPVPTALGVIVAGSVAGAALVAALAPVGSRLGVPSVIAARAALGVRGAALVAGMLYVTNFAWIAINNVIAASACAQVLGGPASERVWAVALGLVSTAIVAQGPAAVRFADRFAVPLMGGIGIALTVACLRLPAVGPPAAAGGQPWLHGFDLVVGYQVSWILMFADYSRYTASPGRSAVAVFFGLALTSAWMMPLGLVAARAAGTADPGAMLAALGLGAAGAALLALATLTTNFVNIYLSALAWKSLVPTAGDRRAVWSIGVIGTGLSLLSRAWLDRYGDFMIVLGGLLVPAGGVLIARFAFGDRPAPEELYERPGEPRRIAGVAPAGLIAWLAGAAVYHAAGAAGRTIPALATAVLAYLALRRVWR
jgi:purine-cytosine permease-like protein